jgi:hypothetical protein
MSAIEGDFSRKLSLGAGDGCAANHCQPRLLLVAELDQIADAGAGDPGICNGPIGVSCAKRVLYVIFNCKLPTGRAGVR